MKFHSYSLKVSANVKIAMQCFEFSWGQMPQMPPLLARLIVALRVFSSCIPTWSPDSL